MPSSLRHEYEAQTQIKQTDFINGYGCLQSIQFCFQCQQYHIQELIVMPLYKQTPEWNFNKIY